MLLALVLYGSRARGDHRAKSDVDLLGVVEEGAFRREIAAGGTSLYHYPAMTMLERSRQGDLFILHVVREGKVLHDTFGTFKTVKESFKFRESYADTIRDASLVLRFLMDRERVLRQKHGRKRMVWAIRTILIGRCAEQQEACFSSAGLASFSRITELKDLIDNRNLAETAALTKAARRVLTRFGDLDELEWPAGPADQRALMRARGGIAKDTLKLVQPVGLVKGIHASAPEPLAIGNGEYF